MASRRAPYVLVVGLWLSGCAPADAKPAPVEPGESGEFLLYDFSVDDALSWAEPQQTEIEAFLRRFPHPHAPAGAFCDPNLPGTPPEQRMGGRLLPRVTYAQGAFTRAGSAQTAYFIDYCLTGVGVPRTRRVVVVQGEDVVLDHELASDVSADEVLRAVDVDGDGLAELLLTVSLFDEKTTQSTTGALLYQLRGGAPRVLGRWTGIAHCYSGHDDMTTHRIHYRRRGRAVSFRDEPIEKHCYYPPAPPAPR